MKTYYWEFGTMYCTAVYRPDVRWHWVRKHQGDTWTVWSLGRWNFSVGCVGAKGRCHA